MSGAPLDLRELFAVPWEGEGSVRLARWLRWFPAPLRFTFRTEITDVDGDRWTVLDTTTPPRGRVQRRRMRAERTAPDRVRLTGGDMPQGATIVVGPDGFDFAPYTIRTPVLGPLRLPLRYTDTVRLLEDGALSDRIELHLARVPVARISMTLHRVAPSPVDCSSPAH